MGHAGLYHTDGIIISTRTDSQSKPRKGSPRKDVLGQSFQMENLHGMSRLALILWGWGQQRKPPNPTNGAALKSYVVKWDAVNLYYGLFGKSLLNKHSHLLFKCKTIKHFMVYCHKEWNG